jgi:hypothetical protein
LGYETVVLVRVHPEERGSRKFLSNGIDIKKLQCPNPEENNLKNHVYENVKIYVSRLFNYFDVLAITN